MSATYASLRSVTPGITLAAVSGGSLSGSGTLFFRVQAKNRYGRNIGSAITSVAYSPTQKIQVTIGSTARANGEDIFKYIVSLATTNSAAAMRRVASWYARDPLTVDTIDYPGQGSDRTLPHTIELSRDAHISTSIIVANLAALPTGSDLIHGMIRQVTTGNGGTIPNASYLRYDSEAVEGDYAAAIGYWILSADWEWQTNQSSTTAEHGCDRLLVDTDPSEVLQLPPYPGDASDGEPLKVWLSNGLTADGGAVIAAGTRVSANLYVNGNNYTEIFSQLFELRLDGYVDRTTGILNTAMAGVGVWQALAVEGVDTSFVRLSGIALPIDLDRGVAVQYSARLKFQLSEIQDSYGSVLTADDAIQIRVYFEGLRGVPSSLWDFTGDCVIEGTDGNLRILPTTAGIKRASGRAVIKGFSFPTVGEQAVSTLAADTAGQAIAISGALAGVCRVGTPNSTEAQRALVSTSAGTQTPSAYTSNITIAGTQVINLTLSYPTVIRADYPDVIAGTTAQFNAPNVRVFVKRVSTSAVYEIALGITPPATTLSISALPGSTTTLPGASASTFGLFGYNAIGAVAGAGAGSLPADNYQIAIAYHYPSPNTDATAISHATSDGNIPELVEIGGAFEATKYWGKTSTIAAFQADATLSTRQVRFVTDALDGQLFEYNPASTETADSVFVYTHNTLPGRIVALLPIDAAGLRNKPLTEGRRFVDIPISQFSPRSDNGCSALATSAATTPGRPDLRHLAFDDTTTQYAQAEIGLGNSWDKNAISYQIVWTGLTADTGGVTWALQSVAQVDDDPVDVDYGVAVEVDDVFLAARQRHITPESSPVTIAGSTVNGAVICLQLYRNTAATNDTRAAAANLLGVRIWYNVDAPNDA